MSRLSSGDEYQAPKGGLILLYCLIMFLFCVFALRFWYLQVHKGEYYADKARENRLRQDAVYAPRGLIRDAGGELIAVNEPAYALGLVRDECLDVDATLEQVARWSGHSLEELKADFAKGRRRLKPFEPIILVSNISFELLSVVEANEHRWPGLTIVMRPNRRYRYGPLVAHIIGYVAEANEEEIDRDTELSMGDYVGKQGIELMQEKRLRGVKGSRQTEVDATGRHLGEAVTKPPQAGRGRGPVHRSRPPAARHGPVPQQDRLAGGHGPGHRAAAGPGQFTVLRPQHLCGRAVQRTMDQAARRRAPPPPAPGHPERVSAGLGVQAGHGRGGIRQRHGQPGGAGQLPGIRQAGVPRVPLLAQGGARTHGPGKRPDPVLRRVFLQARGAAQGGPDQRLCLCRRVRQPDRHRAPP